jgi:hypothetical protein
MQDESWRQLCEAIMKEKDPHRLMQMAAELNIKLEEREIELRRTRSKHTNHNE